MSNYPTRSLPDSEPAISVAPVAELQAWAPGGLAVVELNEDAGARVVAASAGSRFAPGDVLTMAGNDFVDVIEVIGGSDQSGSKPRLAVVAARAVDGLRELETATALIIDDEASNREYYTSVFDHIGWRCTSVATGRLGVTAFSAAEPAVVLVDVRLPDMNGYDVCRQLRAVDRRQCLLVLVSADPSMVDPIRAASAGADLALVSPVGISQLRTILEHRPLIQPPAWRGSAPVQTHSPYVLQLFGEPRIFNGDGWFEIPHGTATDIISVLATHHPSTLSTSDLRDLAWSKRPTSTGPVYTALSRLRTFLAEHGCEELVVTSAHGYRLGIDPKNIDTLAFELAASEIDAESVDDHEFISQVNALLGQCSEMVFGNSSVPAAESARIRIVEMQSLLEERKAIRQILIGDAAAAVATARRVTARELWRETAWMVLILALYRSGRQRESLETYQVARKLLINTVGVDPCPAMRQLERHLLDQDPALDDPAYVRSIVG